MDSTAELIKNIVKGNIPFFWLAFTNIIDVFYRDNIIRFKLIYRFPFCII